MVRGINTTLYEHLKDKISVHSWEGRCHTASPQFYHMLRAESGWFRAMENQGNSCGQDSETLKAGEAALNLYVRMIVDARQLRQRPARCRSLFGAPLVSRHSSMSCVTL